MTSTLTALRKFVAPEFVFGVGAADLTGQHVANLSASKVLLVTDPGLLQTAWPERIMRSLADSKIEYAVFSAISSNPRDHEVMAGADAYRNANCDAIVAIGGGSPIDCAKGIGIVCSNNRSILDFEGVDRVDLPGPPLICIPSTSGSAADVSQFCIINDSTRRVKIAIVSKTMVPDLSLIDPEITVDMPADLTAHTGLDALTHAVEAYVSNASSPFTDMYALHSVKAIHAHLRRAINHPEDLEARAGMSLASTYAGLAFSNAILGAVHAMSHSLGGLLDLPHGLCNAILLDHVITFNFEAAPDKYTILGRALGADIPDGATSTVAKEATIEAFRDFKKQCGVTVTLEELGVTHETIRILSRSAISDPCMLTNPRPATIEDIEKVYSHAR